jgi:hypothetical protein
MSSEESRDFFSSITFQEFAKDLKDMIMNSDMSEQRMHDLAIRIDALIKELEQGFELDHVRFLFMKHVQFDINDSNERDIFNYFVHSVKVLYEKFRIIHPIDTNSDVELSTSSQPLVPIY